MAMRTPRIRCISQENAGVSAARNRGIAAAQADLISFLDADDEYRPGFLATVLRLRGQYPQAGAFSTAYEIKEPGAKCYAPPFSNIPSAPWEGIIPNYLQALLSCSPVSSSSTSVPRSIFRAVGTFPVGVRDGEDLDMWLRIALKYPMAFSRYTGATYHRDSARRSVQGAAPGSELRYISTAREALISDAVPDALRAGLRELIEVHRLAWARDCVLAGEMGKARELLKTCHPTGCRGRKLWWSFWAALPRGLVSACFFLKIRILNRGIQEVLSVFESVWDSCRHRRASNKDTE